MINIKTHTQQNNTNVPYLSDTVDPGGSGLKYNMVHTVYSSVACLTQYQKSSDFFWHFIPFKVDTRLLLEDNFI